MGIFVANRPRTYRVVRELSVLGRNKTGLLAIDISDGARGLLEEFGDSITSYSLRAARHTAYTYQKLLKDEINAGTRLRPLSQIRNPRIFRAVKAMGPAIAKKHGVGLSSKSMALSRHESNAGRRLVQAIGYEKRVDGSVFGWLSKSAQLYGAAVQQGRRSPNLAGTGKGAPQPITKKMRKYFFAIGMYGPQKGRDASYQTMRIGTQRINQEPRPLVEPFFREHQSAMGATYSARFIKIAADFVARRTSRTFGEIA